MIWTLRAKSEESQILIFTLLFSYSLGLTRNVQISIDLNSTLCIWVAVLNATLLMFRRKDGWTKKKKKKEKDEQFQVSTVSSWPH